MPSLRLKKLKAPDCNPIEWNAFAVRHGWFWHTTYWREYTQACTGADESGFAITLRGETVAIAQSQMGERGTVWAPAVRRDLSRGERSAVLDLCLQEMEREQREPFRLVVQPYWHEALAVAIRRGYRDASLTTLIIDLRIPEEQLFADMRKDHRASARRDNHIIRITRSRVDFVAFKGLYEQVAARPLRLIRDWLDLGYVAVATAWDGSRCVSATLLLLYGDAAYPFAAAGSDGTAGHAAIWESMRWLKAHGYRQLELGAQHRDPEASTEKERNISLFKRGFGGIEMPLIIRERP